jgi:hypothetical protein
VKIRLYNERDEAALREMHARQGFDYPFPDLRDPIFVSKLVMEDDSGRVIMASLGRLTCEMYFLLEPGVNNAKPASPADVREAQSADRTGLALRSGSTGTPRDRYMRMLALHRAAEQDLVARGLDDAHAWLPPRIARRFGRRLERLGWVRDDAWTPYCFHLGRKEQEAHR